MKKPLKPHVPSKVEVFNLSDEIDLKDEHRLSPSVLRRIADLIEVKGGVLVIESGPNNIDLEIHVQEPEDEYNLRYNKINAEYKKKLEHYKDWLKTELGKIENA